MCIAGALPYSSCVQCVSIRILRSGNTVVYCYGHGTFAVNDFGILIIVDLSC